MVFLRFYGPAADDGRINIEKVGKTLVALNRWFRRYSSETVGSQQAYVLRAGDIKRSCSEVQIFLDAVVGLSQTAPGMVATGSVMLGSVFKNTGIRAFLDGFMGTLGKQVALKQLAKGNKITLKRTYFKDGVAYVELETESGTTEMTEADWKLYQATANQLNGIVNLDKGSEEKLKIGYRDKNKKDKVVAEATYADRESFQDVHDPDLIARRLNEPFEEDRAESVRLIGKFIDYHGLAHKYHFTFQVRKNQAKFGKQKILCIVKKGEHAHVLDLLKPEKGGGNIHVGGLATKDQEGRLDKLKVQWISEDPKYDPRQTKIE